MNDLFGREQKVLDQAIENLNHLSCDGSCGYALLVKEYGKLLKQTRCITKISDKTTIDLNTSKMDLMDKVHYDGLTGIYNRRFLEDNLKRVVKTLARVGGNMLSVMMIDIDYFKNYNDTYGHSMGDDCLKAIAEAIAGSLSRADDYAARYGGEEFTIVLPNTGESGARKIAEIVLENVRALGIPHQTSEAASFVTVSIGVASGRVRQKQTGDLYILQADKALYTTKQQGRNGYTYIHFEEADARETGNTGLL